MPDTLFESLRADRKWKNNRLVFHDFIPERDLNELYLRSHIQVIPEKPGFSEGAIPSKLPNILAAGASILYIGTKNSDVWQVVQASEAGLCAASWEFEMLNMLVERLLSVSSGRSHAERRHTFRRTFGAFFNTDSLIRELLG